MNTTLHVPRDRRALAARIDPLLRTPLATLLPEQVLEVRSPAVIEHPASTRPDTGRRDIERRMVPVSEVRFLDEEEHPGRFRAVVLRYGVVDAYNTVFERGVFTASMAQRMPRICWAHRWDQPIGRWIDHEETEDALILTGELDLEMIPGTDQPAVPLAHQGRAQLRSGTIDQFSVGFMRTAERDGSKEYGPGVQVITGGVLDEVSLVLVGAVPGTHPVDLPRHRLSLSVRMPGEPEARGDDPVMIPLDEAARVFSRMALGDLDLADGLQALKALASDQQADPDGGDGDQGDGEDGEGGEGDQGDTGATDPSASQRPQEGQDNPTPATPGEDQGSAQEADHTSPDGDGSGTGEGDATDGGDPAPAEDPDADLIAGIDKALEVIG